MASMRVLIAASLVVLSTAAANGAKAKAKVSPVEKVLQMMGDLKAKGLKEKNDDMVHFKTFTQFCMDTNAAKGQAISDGDDQIQKLKADMEQANNEARVLGREMEKLDGHVAQATADKAKSKKDFETEEHDYRRMHAEYDLNIADTEKAIDQVKMMMAAENMLGKGKKEEAAESLIQFASRPKFPAHERRVLMSFLATSTSTELQRLSAPEGATYESQSGGVVDLMAGLAEKFAQQKAQLEREFVKTQGSFQVMQQNFGDQVEQHTMMRDVKSGTKKDKEADASSAAGDIASTQRLKAEDELYLKEVNSECAAKSAEYESRQGLAAGEIKALNKAIEILSGGAVSGTAEKHLPSLVQGASLAQLRSSLATGVRQSQFIAASFLQAAGRRMNSRLLATLISHMKNDPFSKVKKMIEDMVQRLMEEASEEAEHKGFCDTELGTNKMTRDQKTTQAEELTANIDDITSRMGQIGVEMTDLSERISETDAAVQKATSMRNDEKAKNAATIKEAAGAKEAVMKALGVLRDYYDSAAETALIQVHSSTGILGMLEVILSDFERLEADTKASEKTGQGEFEKFLNDSNQEKAISGQEVKNKEESRTEADVSLGVAKRDLASVQEELEAANAYFQKLRPSCVTEEVSYGDRVQRRKEEIESLKEALRILDEQNMA